MTTETPTPVTVTPVAKPAEAVSAPVVPVVEVKAANAAPVTEEKTAEVAATEEEKKNKPRGVSKYLATIKEREAAAAEKEALIAEREQKLQEKEQNAAKENGLTAEDLKLRPLEFLKKFGMTFEEFAKAVINEGQPPSADDRVAKVEEKLSKIEQDKLDKEKADAEAKIKSEQDYIDKTTNNYKVMLKAEIEAKPDDYELIIANGAHDLVFEVVENYWHKHQKILDLHEACKATEDFLLEKARRIMSLKKLAVKKEEDKKSQSSGMKTLTNGVGSHSIPSTGIPAGLTREERLKMATQKLRYN